MFILLLFFHIGTDPHIDTVRYDGKDGQTLLLCPAFDGDVVVTAVFCDTGDVCIGDNIFFRKSFYGAFQTGNRDFHCTVRDNIHSGTGINRRIHQKFDGTLAECPLQMGFIHIHRDLYLFRRYLQLGFFRKSDLCCIDE